MKYVKYEEHDGMFTKEFILACLQSGGPNNAVTYDEGHKRERIWDAYDNNKDPCGLQLEDADHEVLKTLVKRYQFPRMTRAVLALCRNILDAGAPPAPLLPPKKDGDAKDEGDESKKAANDDSEKKAA